MDSFPLVGVFHLLMVQCRIIISHDLRFGSEYLMMSMEILGTPNNGTPIPILLPYHSHKNPLEYGNGVGSL